MLLGAQDVVPTSLPTEHTFSLGQGSDYGQAPFISDMIILLVLGKTTK